MYIRLLYIIWVREINYKFYIYYIICLAGNVLTISVSLVDVTNQYTLDELKDFVIFFNLSKFFCRNYKTNREIKTINGVFV